MDKKTFLITGGAGFIGSSLSEKLLAQGHVVVNIDNFCDFYSPAIKERNIHSIRNNPRYFVFRTDIRDRKALQSVFESFRIDVVIHLAAMAGVRPSIADPVLYEEVNLQGTLNVLECVKSRNIKKFLFASSSSVYGDTQQIPFKENNCGSHTISPYAATKKAGEEFCHLYHSLYQIDIAILRFFTVYGPRQRPDLAIHKFTDMIFNRQPIPFYGDGSTMRDYAFIDDITDGIEKSIRYISENNGVCEAFNLSGNHSISLKDMVNKIATQLKIPARIHSLPMQPGDVENTRADISKAQHLLGYSPHTTFEEGISKFVNWYMKVDSLALQMQ